MCCVCVWEWEGKTCERIQIKVRGSDSAPVLFPVPAFYEKAEEEAGLLVFKTKITLRFLWYGSTVIMGVPNCLFSAKFQRNAFFGVWTAKFVHKCSTSIVILMWLGFLVTTTPVKTKMFQSLSLSFTNFAFTISSDEPEREQRKKVVGERKSH